MVIQILELSDSKENAVKQLHKLLEQLPEPKEKE
jgi:hypothetical protein